MTNVSISSLYLTMSLLNFFAQQRKRWGSQPADDQSADYLLGGIAALEQAEAAFQATPLYNFHQRLAIWEQVYTPELTQL